LQYFKKITTETSNFNKKNAVIMWRKTWESIPLKFRPLQGRENYVLSRQKNSNIEWAHIFNTIEKCLTKIWENNSIEKIFIIGWAKIYDSLLYNDNLEKIYLTRVVWDWWCDTFFRWTPKYFSLVSESEMYENKNSISYQFQIYKKTQEV
jgi:dihydrofolate reductase